MSTTTTATTATTAAIEARLAAAYPSFNVSEGIVQMQADIQALLAVVARLEERDEGRVRGVDHWRATAETEHAETLRLRYLFMEVYARNQAQRMGIRWREWADEQHDQWRKEAREWLDGERERLDSHGLGPTIAELLADAQG